MHPQQGRPLDTLTITTEAAPGASAETAEGAAHHLADRIKNTIGVTAALSAPPAGTVERSSGKMRRVVDERAA
jgi:phenylacetate-CoA ligase